MTKLGARPSTAATGRVRGRRAPSRRPQAGENVSTGWACSARRNSEPTRCQAASSSAWRSLARLRSDRASSSRTSPSPVLIRRRAKMSSICYEASAGRRAWRSFAACIRWIWRGPMPTALSVWSTAALGCHRIRGTFGRPQSDPFVGALRAENAIWRSDRPRTLHGEPHFRGHRHAAPWPGASKFTHV